MSGAATLTVRFTGEVNDLEKKAQKAKRAIEGPMKDLEKPGFWSKITGRAGKAGAEAGESFSSKMGEKTKAGAGKLGGVLKLGLVGVAAKLGLDFGNEFMSALSGASNLEQSKGGLAAVFKKDTAELDKVAQGAAKSLGLSRNSYNELATVLGAGLKNKGLTDYADKTQDLIGLGADLSAMYGGTAADAVSAISSLMRGESDPIEKYGVAISDTAIKAELAAKGQDKLTGAALEQAKAQARLDILFRQTADAQGTFGRESDTLAGKQQRAGAMWEDLKTKIGEKFLPAASGAMGWLMDKGIPGFERFASVAESSIGAVWDLFSKGDATNLLTMLGIDQDNKAVVWLGETRDMVVDAWGGIQGALEDAWTVIEPIASEIWDTLTSKWSEIAPKVEDTFGTVQRIISEVMLAAELIIEGVTGNISKVWDLWGENILTQIDIVFDTVSSIFSGFATTVEGIWTTFTGILSGDWDKAADGITLIAEGLGTALGGIWTGIKDGALNAWGAMVTGIGAAWDGVKSIVAQPINVVIGFINDGIIGSYNWVAEKLGLGTMGKIPLLKTGSSSGRGSAGGRGAALALADGGFVRLPWDPANRDPYLGVTPAGAFRFEGEEFFVKRSSTARLERKHPGLLDYINRFGDLPGHADGGLVNLRGHRFTKVFAAAIQAAEAALNKTFRITQGGFRPRTSYSGTSHQGDAVDIARPYSAADVAALRASGVAAWDRAGKGNWIDHIHGVPLPGYGRGAGSAVWQAQDYLRGGDGLGGRDNGPRGGAITQFLGAIGGAIKAGFDTVKGWFDSIMSKVSGAWDLFTGDVGGGALGKLVTGIGEKLRSDLGDWVKGKLGYRSGGVAGSGLHWVGEGGPELLDLKGGERIRTLSQLRGRGQTSQGAGMDELVDRLVEAIASREVPSVEVALVEGDIRRVVRSEVRAMGVRV